MLNVTAVVKQLQEMRDEGYLSDALLRYAVKSIAGSSDRYNWIGAFLVKDGGLWLHNYVGEPAQYAQVPVGTGVGGVAVADRKNQNIPDVSAWGEGYQPCAPDIRSELVVLIRAGDEILGEIDVASETASAFSEEDEKAIQSICDKLAEQIASERR